MQPLAVQRAGHRGAARAADALAGASARYAALGPVHPDTRFPSLRFGALTFVGVRVPRSHRRRLHPPLARQVYMPRYTDTLSKQASFCSARRSGAQHFSHKPGAWCSGHGSITLPRWSYRCICYSERWSTASEIAGLSLTRLPACLPAISSRHPRRRRRHVNFTSPRRRDRRYVDAQSTMRGLLCTPV